MFFRGGVATAGTLGGRNDWYKYIACNDYSRPWFSYSGCFRLGGLDEGNLVRDQVMRRGYQIPEASKDEMILLDDHSRELADFSRLEI